jgi:hypothetical protein
MAFSLGTSAGAGTISIVAGGSIVTGVGTNFQAANVGAILVVGAQWGVIASRASTTSVTLDRPFATAVTGSAYTISANIPVITQTGTDTSLSTLTGVAGVTVSTNLWTITSATLVVNGSLTINRLTNRIRFLNPANLVTAAVTPPTLTVGATGTFNNSVVQTSGGYTYRSPNYSIMFDGVIPTLAATTGSLIGTVLGSTSVFEGNIEFANLLSGAVLTFNFEGTTTLQYGALLNSQSGANNILFYVNNASSNLTINNYTSVGISLRVANNALTINNYAAIAGPNAININTGSAVNNPQYVGLQSLGSASASVRTAGVSLKYLQLVNYSDTALVPLASLASTTGSQVLFVNQLSLSASGSAGAIQDAKFWARDSNNGSRSPANYGAGLGYEIATTGNLTYTATTNASGIAPTLDIISVIYWQNTASTFLRDYRGNDSSTSQNLNIYQCAYNYALSNSLTNLYPLSATGIYGGASARSQTFVLLADTSITQSNMATVSAYTLLNTAQELYDYAKFVLYTNFAGETATYVTRSGDTINAGSYNVVIDATATTPFVVDGSTITVDSLTFTGSLTTTGLVTLANGAIFSGNTVTANVAQATPTNLTGVTINGNLTYNTNTPITITLTNCAITGTVSNSGTGAVTISRQNSTIGTAGANVTTRPVTSLNLTGLTAGSQIYVANGSGTQVAYVASSGTSYTLDTTGQTGTWTWKVARYGFTAQTGTHSPAVASTTTSVTLVADLFITQANKATVAAYEFLPNMDTLYDYSAYYETLEIGIPYARIITKAGTNASAGAYPVTINDTGDVFIFDGSSLSIWCGDRLSPGVTITGALFSSSPVTIPYSFGNTAITANVIQLIPSDLSSMTITGNLTYNNDDPYAYTAIISDSTITGTISNSGVAEVKVIKAGTSPFFTAGARVRVVAVVSVTTANNLPLSTYITKNGGVSLGWVVEDTARSFEVSATDTFKIYAIAYGYQPTLFTAVATNNNSFRTSLIPETNVNTTLSTTVRDTIANTIAANFDQTGKIVVTFNATLAQYSPAEVLNGFHYYTVIGGSNIGLGVIMANTTQGLVLIQGGFEISSPGFYAQVANSVTSVVAAGFLVPLYVSVTPSVYAISPTYTPTRKNSSGIVLQTAPWTQQTATISQADKGDIRSGLALDGTVAKQSSLSIVNEGVKKASKFIPHNQNL